MMMMNHEAVKHLCNSVFRAASILQMGRWQNTAEVDDFTRGSKVLKVGYWDLLLLLYYCLFLHQFHQCMPDIFGWADAERVYMYNCYYLLYELTLLPLHSLWQFFESCLFWMLYICHHSHYPSCLFSFRVFKKYFHCRPTWVLISRWHFDLHLQASILFINLFSICGG